MNNEKIINRLRIKAAKAAAESQVMSREVTIAEREQDLDRLRDDIRRQKELIAGYDKTLKGMEE